MRTPPGVSDADFTEALRQFESVVGPRWVFTKDEDVATYKDAYSPFWNEPEDKWCGPQILDPAGLKQSPAENVA